jgi:putative DNA primase/helicase
LLLYGEGSNGKSTLITTVAWLMGDFAMTIPVQALLVNDRKGGSEATPELARLPGARLVHTSEPRQGAVFDEALLKRITGGESMPARHLNKGFFDFTPAFKLVAGFNRRPIVRGDDDGTWRRFLMVPFDVKMPEGKVDKDFLAARLKPEGSAILNWLIEGYRAWRQDGLAVPQLVRDAIDDYREESDPVGNFLTAQCFVTGERRDVLTGRELWDRYKYWCEDSGAEPVSQTKFGRRLAVKRGVRRLKSGTVSYSGITWLMSKIDAEARNATRRGSDGPAGPEPPALEREF